ncbi:MULTISPECIES: CpaF family protein [Aquabacterium]|jgi:pilus assembly protein CpaF|uniref:CpaF family protein n=1 Tax=Aquabacterium TaxID=92793 RepID=UPI000718C8F4|nr:MULTISPECIES: CpaF family protein [Aquabacterium]MBU0915168.1 CpaF family protein [Gammaproteobacteria bacterium]
MDYRSLATDYSLKSSDSYQDVKLRLHHYLIDRIDTERVSIGEMGKAELSEFVLSKVQQYVAEHRLPVSRHEMENLSREMVDELTGYGPLEELIRDDRINDILVNGTRHIYVERNGILSKTDMRFIDDEHVLRVIRRILAPLGRRIDESSPMVDARLPDGSRVNAIIPPLALDGPCLSIRKFRKDPLQATDLLASGTFNEEMLVFLEGAVQRRCNILISGGTGAGKTTLLNVLSRSISPYERLVTIEDAAELQLGHEHVVRLETRPPNVDGRGEVTARDLMRNALRMRPDRVLLGEVRSHEVLDMLQAMNTGHDGCMSTVHANSPRDALLRLEMLAGFAGFQGQDVTLKHMIATALDLVIQVGRLADGRRRVLAISEVLGVQDERIVTNELFVYQPDRKAFESTGLSPASPKLRLPDDEQATKFHRSW